MSIHAVLLKLHLWVALTVGLFVLILGATGVLLVFGPAYDRAMFPELRQITPEEARVSLQELVDRSRTAGTPNLVVLPERPDESAQVFVRTATGVSTAYLNPYSGAILGVRSVAEQQKGLNLTVRRFHRNLLLGVPGGHFVAIVTILAVFMSVSGLVLWWRRKIARLKTSASWPRINFDLHNVVGLYSSAVLLVLSLSGIVIYYPQVSNLIKGLDAPDLAEPRAPRPAGDPRPLSLDDLAAIAQAAVPGSTTAAVTLPGTGSAVIRFGQRFPRDGALAGRSAVWLDMFTGKPLRVDNSRQPQRATLGSRLLLMNTLLHVGVLYSPITDVVVFLGAAGQVVLVVTGFVIWWRRKFRAARSTAGVTDARGGQEGAGLRNQQIP